MTQPVYLHVGGIISPLQVVLSLVNSDEKIEEIPSYARRFLLGVFLKVADPAIFHCLKVMQKEIFCRQVLTDWSGVFKVEVFTSAYRETVDYRSTIVEMEITRVGNETIEALKEAFEKFRDFLCETSGLLWLEIDTKKLSLEAIEIKHNEMMGVHDHLVDQKIEKVNQRLADDRQITEKEKQIRSWLEGVLEVPRRDFSLKRRKKEGSRILFHLWINVDFLDSSRLRDFGLSAKTGYRPIEEIFAIVEKAVAEKKKTDSTVLETSTPPSSDEEGEVKNKSALKS